MYETPTKTMLSYAIAAWKNWMVTWLMAALSGEGTDRGIEIEGGMKADNLEVLYEDDRRELLWFVSVSAPPYLYYQPCC
jgi:hypothetical protein